MKSFDYIIFTTDHKVLMDNISKPIEELRQIVPNLTDQEIETYKRINNNQHNYVQITLMTNTTHNYKRPKLQFPLALYKI